jgi:hypothetical protein
MPKANKRQNYGGGFCGSGSIDNCSNAYFLPGKPSPWFDGALLEATRQVNAIVTDLERHIPAGRELRVVNTGLELPADGHVLGPLMFQWVLLEPPPIDILTAVTSESSEAEIRAAFDV